MNRAQIAAVAAQATELAAAAQGLLAADSNLQGLESLRRSIVPEAWAPISDRAYARIKDAQWKYDYMVAGLRRLMTKEPT